MPQEGLDWRVTGLEGTVGGRCYGKGQSKESANSANPAAPFMFSLTPEMIHRKDQTEAGEGAMDHGPRGCIQ